MAFENYDLVENYNLYGVVHHLDGRMNKLQYVTTKDYLQSEQLRDDINAKKKSYYQQQKDALDVIKSFDSNAQQKNALYTDEDIAKTKQPMGAGKKKKNGGLLFPIKTKRVAPSPQQLPGGLMGIKKSLYD
jgi:hypothetical protein